MNLKKYFSFESKPIPVENIFYLTEDFLDDLYVNSSEVEQFNIFFHLQNKYFFLKNTGKIQETAYIMNFIKFNR